MYVYVYSVDGGTYGGECCNWYRARYNEKTDTKALPTATLLIQNKGAEWMVIWLISWEFMVLLF